MNTAEQPTFPRAFELPLHHAPAEVWKLMRDCWNHSVMLANWCQTTLLSMDDLLSPKPPPIDLYNLAITDRGFPHHAFFGGATGSATCVTKRVYEKYKKERPEVIRFRRSTPSYKVNPWYVRGDLVTDVWLDPNGRPVVAIKLPSGQAGESLPVELRLRCGREFGPQMAHFRNLAIAADAARPTLSRDDHGRPLVRTRHKFSELALREKRCRGGDVMVKFIVKLPVRQRTGDRTMLLATDPNAFWLAELDGQPAWTLNNRHWRRVLARHEEHLATLARMRQDAKAERRLRSNRAWQQQTRLDLLCEKDHNRIASFTHEAACHLAEYARRQGVAEVFYLDSDCDFFRKADGSPLSFPWHELHGKLAQKLEERGIALHSESGFDLSPSPEPDNHSDGTIALTPQENQVCLRSAVRQATERLRAIRKAIQAASRQRERRSHKAVIRSPKT